MPSSREYWKEREERQRQLNITEEIEYSRRIEKIFQKMYSAIQSDIDDFYVKYAKAEGITLAEAKRRVSQLDIDEYAAKAKRYVEQAAKDRAANGGKTDKKASYFSDQANAEMRLYNATMKINRLELLKANIGLEMVDGFDELEKIFGDALSKRAMDEFKRQAGILGKTILNNEKLAHSIVNASFHNAKFSHRIWMAQDLLKYRLNEILTQGLIQGLNPRDITKRVMPLIKKEIINNKRAAAERLLRTELCRVQTDAQMQSYQKNGYDQYIFLAEPTACKHCKALDNKVFPIGKMAIGENAPPIHPNCRCSTSAYSESDAEYEKWIKETTGEHSAQWELEQGMASKDTVDAQKWYQERLRDKGYDINRWHQVRTLVKGNAFDQDQAIEKIARYPISEGVFTTIVNPLINDGRLKQTDIIKPRNIIKNLKSTNVGKKAYEFILDSDISIELLYNVDNPDNLSGAYDPIDKKIKVFADKTKTIKESALTVIHEATHARLGGTNTQKEEYLCFLEEYKHIGVKLTEKLKNSIINHIKNSEIYRDLPWE